MINRWGAWTFAIAAVVVAAVILVPLFGFQGAHPSGPAGLVGQPAPVYPMADDTGKPVSLVQYRGDVVLMNLWASWCPPCRAEMPDLQRLAQAYRGRDLAVVGVNEGESAGRARSFATSLGVAFPIWVDEQQRYGRVYAALGLPTTVIVGKDGSVLRAFDGPLAYAQMRAVVDGLVSAH